MQLNMEKDVGQMTKHTEAVASVFDEIFNSLMMHQISLISSPTEIG